MATLETEERKAIVERLNKIQCMDSLPKKVAIV